MQGVVQKFGDAAWRTTNIAIPPLPALSVPTTLWAYLGGSLAQSQNMVAGAPPITVVAGTPYWPVPGNCVSVGPTSSTLPGGGYLDTGVRDDSSSFTIFLVCRLNAVTGVSKPLENSDPGAGNRGIAISIQQNPTPGLNCVTNGNGINRTLGFPNVTTFKLFGITYDDPTFTMDMWDFTSGTTDHFVGTSFARQLAPSTTFWIGANQAVNTGLANPSDVAFVGKSSGSVNATQAQAIAANIRSHMALTGMMV